MIAYPDYDHSILSITNSILKFYGANPIHATLPLLDQLLQKNYKNVILFVLDGMGTHVLERNLPENSFIRQNNRMELSSVFPSTTTAAITSIVSGKTPNEHGWVGWSCYFQEIDACVDLFSGNKSGFSKGVPAYHEHIPSKLLGYEDIFSQIHRATDGKVSTYSVSPFSDFRANAFEDVCRHLETLSRTKERKFIYAYHNQPDHDLHDFGVGADCIRAMLEKFDQRMEHLGNQLDDTLLLITADHGMIDMTMKCIEEYPELHACLHKPVCMEPRCCSFYVKDDDRSRFPELFNWTLGEHFMLFTHDEFIQSKLLGEGTAHPKVKDFIGDYVAVAISNIGLWYRDDQGDYNDFKGGHAGLCKEEMTVPFITIEKKI